MNCFLWAVDSAVCLKNEGIWQIDVNDLIPEKLYMVRGEIEFVLSWCVLLLLMVVPSRNATLPVSIVIAALPLFARSTTFTAMFPTFEMLAVGILAIRHAFEQWKVKRLCGSPHGLRHLSRVLFRLDQSLSWDWALAAIFWVTAFASCLLSCDPRSGFMVLLSGGTIPLIVYFLIRDSLATQKDWLTFRSGMCALGVITASVVIAGYWYRLSLGILSSLDTAGLNSLYLGQNPAVLFEVPSVDGAIIVMSLPFLFHASVWQSGRLRWAARAGVVLLLAAALFTLKRGIWLATGIEVAFLMIILLKHISRDRHFLKVFIMAGILLALIPLLSPMIAMVFDSRQAGDEYFHSADIRTMNYSIALNSGAKNIVSGFGLTRYPEVYGLLPNHPAAHVEPLWFAHNLFLTLIPEIGLLGALAFALLAIKPIIRAIVSQKGMFHHIETSVCVVAITGALVNATITGTYLVNSFAEPKEATLGCAATLVVFALAGALAGMGARAWTLPS